MHHTIQFDPRWSTAHKLRFTSGRIKALIRRLRSRKACSDDMQLLGSYLVTLDGLIDQWERETLDKASSSK